jgi:hypothetical protein
MLFLHGCPLGRALAARRFVVDCQNSVALLCLRGNDGSGGREPALQCYDDMRFLQRVYAAAATLAPELVAAREAPHDGSSDKPRFSEKVVRNQ